MSTNYFLEVDACAHCKRAAIPDLHVGKKAGVRFGVTEFVFRAYGADDGPYRNVIRSRAQWIAFVERAKADGISLRLSDERGEMISTDINTIIHWLKSHKAPGPRSRPPSVHNGEFFDAEGFRLIPQEFQ